MDAFQIMMSMCAAIHFKVVTVPVLFTGCSVVTKALSVLRPASLVPSPFVDGDAISRISHAGHLSFAAPSSVGLIHQM
jgi:hypothetical protein